MKRFLAVIFSALLIFSLTACNNETKNIDSNTSGASQSENTSSVVSAKKKSKNKKSSSDSSGNNKNQSSQNNSSHNNTDESSKIDITNNDDDNNNDNNISENIDNDVLENVSSEKMDVPENMKFLGSNKVKEENNAETVKATVALYQLDGGVVNWITEKDLIYVITSGNNRLVVINSKTMEPVSNVPLAGKPAEINLVGDKIYISLPDLCRIDIFSKASYKKLSMLNFDGEVSSFCIDGNYIYYAEHDQFCSVYKKNLTTNETLEFKPDRGWHFYQPKLYLNKQDNILYIGETGSSGSTLFYYDATTLQLKSLFRKNDYGMYNHTKEIFHIGNEIFWGNYCFSDTEATQIIGRYGKGDYGSVNFASKEIVSTFEGIFLTDTYECVVNYFDAGFKFEYILLTESNNVFFRDRSVDENIILGVNFSLQ